MYLVLVVISSVFGSIAGAGFALPADRLLVIGSFLAALAFAGCLGFLPATTSHHVRLGLLNVCIVFAATLGSTVADVWLPARGLMIVHAIGTIVLTVSPVIVLINAPPVAPDEDRCAKCGYDLTGAATRRCPECGFQDRYLARWDGHWFVATCSPDQAGILLEGPEWPAAAPPDAARGGRIQFARLPDDVEFVEQIELDGIRMFLLKWEQHAEPVLVLSEVGAPLSDAATGLVASGIVRLPLSEFRALVE